MRFTVIDTHVRTSGRRDQVSLPFTASAEFPLASEDSIFDGVPILQRADPDDRWHDRRYEVAQVCERMRHSVSPVAAASV